jgi:hypothetical protein
MSGSLEFPLVDGKLLYSSTRDRKLPSNGQIMIYDCELAFPTTGLKGWRTVIRYYYMVGQVYMGRLDTQAYFPYEF